MNEVTVEIGPLQLEAMDRAFVEGPLMSPKLIDAQQSIRLARAAQRSGGALVSDISLTWRRHGSPVAYSSMCLRRDAGGSVVLQGMPSPLRLPTLLPELDQQTRRYIVDSFQDHLSGTLERIGATTTNVWVPADHAYSRGSIEARWIGSVPTIDAAAELKVDLIPSESEYWRHLRKSYRSLINWGRRELNTTFTSRDQTDTQIAAAVNVLASLHESASGKAIYDKWLWDTANEMIRTGSAVCVLIDSDISVGGVLLLLDESRASYAIGAFNRDLMAEGVPIGHAALWSSINWLRERGYQDLTLGVAVTPSKGDGKQIGIDLFKRGFANLVVPWLVTELDVQA